MDTNQKNLGEEAKADQQQASLEKPQTPGLDPRQSLYAPGNYRTSTLTYPPDSHSKQKEHAANPPKHNPLIQNPADDPPEYYAVVQQPAAFNPPGHYPLIQQPATNPSDHNPIIEQPTANQHGGYYPLNKQPVSNPPGQYPLTDFRHCQQGRTPAHPSQRPQSASNKPTHPQQSAVQPLLSGEQRVQRIQQPIHISGCPPGLECLTRVDQLSVQEVIFEELSSMYGNGNRYVIEDSTGQKMFYAAEDSTTCSRVCFDEMRDFTMHIMNNFGQEVLLIERDLRLCAACNCSCCIIGDCCTHEVAVVSPPGIVIGYVTQKRSFMIYRFVILDLYRKPVLRIDAPCCICQSPSCNQDAEFYVRPFGRVHPAGIISKQWSECCQRCTGKTSFNIAFENNLDVKLKALILGAVFLIDYMFYQFKEISKY